MCAPAGFGKAALLADWARGDPRPVAWLSLDDADNDPARFWRHVAAALDTVRYGVGAQRPWLVIPQRVVHELEVTPGADLVVLSCHTVAREDLLEVSSAGERTYTNPAGT